MKKTRKKIVSKKFEGNTLLETVTAMTIILFIMLLATRIIVSLDKSSNPALQLQAFVLARNEIVNTNNLKDVEEGFTKQGNLFIEQRILDSKENSEIMIFVVTVTNKNKKEVLTLKKLIETNESK